MRNIFLFFLTILTTSDYLLAQDQFNKIGISFQKPSHWICVEDVTFEETFEKTKMFEFQSNQKLHALLEADNQVVEMSRCSKYAIDAHEGLIPSCALSLRPNPADNFQEFKALQLAFYQDFEEAVQDFEFIIVPRETMLSGYKAIETSFLYSIQAVSGEIIRPRCHSYMLSKGLFMISFTLIDQLSDDCTEEFDNLIKTIKISQ